MGVKLSGRIERRNHLLLNPSKHCTNTSSKLLGIGRRGTLFVYGNQSRRREKGGGGEWKGKRGLILQLLGDGIEEDIAIGQTILDGFVPSVSERGSSGRDDCRRRRARESRRLMRG